MTIQERLKLIKAAFSTEPAPAADPVIDPATPAKVTVGYNLDGGTAVYVSKEEGKEGIEVGDSVFSDEAMATPLADGTYKAAEGDFSFTVAGGIVSEVNDATGTGIGTPIQKAPPAADPVIDPAAPMFTAEDLKTPEQLLSAFQKFEGGTPDINSLAVMVKALMEYSFGWQMREAQEKANRDAAIASYQQGFTEQKATIEKQDKIIKDLFAVVEQLATTPTADPIESPKTSKSEKFEKRSERLEALAENFKKLKANNN